MKKNRTEDEIRRPKKMTSIGGQALMEGLMMIGPQTMAMAVRLPDGQIHVESAPIGKSSQAAKIPFVRGSVKIFHQMVTGTRYLLRSAQFIEEDTTPPGTKTEPAIEPNAALLTSQPGVPDDSSEDGSSIQQTTMEYAEESTISTDFTIESAASTDLTEDSTASADLTEDSAALTDMTEMEQDDFQNPVLPEKEPAKNSRKDKDEKGKEKKEKKEKEPGRIEQFLMKHTDVLLYFSAIFGILISVGLFILLPNLLTNLTIGFWVDKNASMTNSIIYSLFEGVLRIAIFIGYLALASNLKDIRRVWMYHGAEHKTISCYESKMPLTVENVRKFSKHHPRCGTAFMFIILILSIIVFSFIPKFNIILDLLTRLACVPLLAGLSYEVIHWSAKHDNMLTRALSWPGLMLQRLTTKEPDDSMLEVAIAAMVPVIPAGERGDEW